MFQNSPIKPTDRCFVLDNLLLYKEITKFPVETYSRQIVQTDCCLILRRGQRSSAVVVPRRLSSSRRNKEDLLFLLTEHVMSAECPDWINGDKRHVDITELAERFSGSARKKKNQIFCRLSSEVCSGTF